MTKLIWRQIAERDCQRMLSSFSNPRLSGTTADHAFAEDFIYDRLLACAITPQLRGDDDLGCQLAQKPVE